MEIKGKTVLVAGMARSGLSAAKLLYRLGARVIVYDKKAYNEVNNLVEELESAIRCEFCLGEEPDKLLEQIDLIVMSPGIPTDVPFLVKAKAMGIKVISEVELAYQYCKAPILAVTGTNGKTTTTTLLGEIVKASGITTHVVGNIGVPFTDKVDEMESSHMAVVEISSFQLQTVEEFHPWISLMLNLTPDHLDRHKTMENYLATKARIFENQCEGDFLILNGEDSLVKELKPDNGSKVYFLSRLQTLEEGAWLENGHIMVNIGKGALPICSVDQVGILGSHNLENALAAALAAALAGVEPTIIAKVLKEFPGVEHRIEKVDTIDGVVYYNDSKGTNPDSSIKAIDAMKGSVVLIAGGYDKKASYGDFIDAFGSKVKELVLLGETADAIAAAAKEKGFNNIHMTKTIEEAVEKACELSYPGWNVLLSPACASWDMFEDFEERGRVFKEAVKALRR
ncbi:MAG: UDP-N-acetylmuramoyl-L-alanine--D-glutamate ligase [Clostridiales bacterium]|nr:UDP-N-acetylmuramoyl-L-alanine--D-glutamate ligase [Clostridiales bacterium]